LSFLLLDYSKPVCGQETVSFHFNLLAPELFF